jgi:colanic acid biosynthesis glycosyl transferase WcaI
MALQLVRRLSSDGNEVSMIVPFPNRPYGRVYEGFHRRLRESTRAREGFQLVHCWNWLIGGNRRVLDRVLENLTFGLSSAWAAWREGRPDVMILETWPLCAALSGVLLARFWRIPVLYYVQDVYPEAVEKAGLIPSGGLLARICRAWDRQICLVSAKVIVISEAVRDLLASTRRLPLKHFVTIPNWADAAEFAPHPTDNLWRREQNIAKDAFVALFAGTLGHVSGVELLVEVAHLLRSKRNVLIVCVGEGIRKPAMVEACRLQGLDNIRFLPFQPRERVAEVLCAANATLLTMQPESSDASVPSKLISYMAAGRPVICSAPRATTGSQIVVVGNAGLVTKPGDAVAIAEAIEQLATHPAEAERMGRNARTYFEQHMTIDRAYGRFTALLYEVLQ